jgi:hypothetical protein
MDVYTGHEWYMHIYCPLAEAISHAGREWYGRDGDK